MEMVLIAVTIVSLGVALVMSVIAWRASQDDKRRAAARIAALATAAGVRPLESADLAGDARSALAPPPTGNIGRRKETAESDALAAFGSEAAPSRPRAGLDVREDVPAHHAVSVQAGFLGAAEEPLHESLRHQRWLMAGAALLAVVLGSLVMVRVVGGGAAPSAVQAAAAPAPLELLSLRHEREGANLSVAGLVRNPPAAPVVERISAVVFLFDQQGQFVTSANAPIDFLRLGGGDESPFFVKVAAPQSVARYRVSFRTDHGTLSHVDRRGEPPAAAALTR